MIPWNGNRGEKRHRRLIETFRTHRRREPRSIFSKNTNRKQREETETEREGGKERERQGMRFRAQQTLKQWRKNRDQDEGYDENGWQIFFFFLTSETHGAVCSFKSVFLLDAGHPQSLEQHFARNLHRK